LRPEAAEVVKGDSKLDDTGSSSEHQQHQHQQQHGVQADSHLDTEDFYA
jgi:hypothetical protein